MRGTALVAIGGNALVSDNDHASIADQFAASQQIAASVRTLVEEGWQVVVTHGNGPQVGFILRRSDLVARLAPEIPRLSLDLCVADSQGGLGYILANSLTNELRAARLPAQVAAVITHVVVSSNDPAFQEPSKPIGSFYTQEESERLRRTEGWSVVEDAGRGWRRVVPSPRPLRILELASIAALVREGTVVVAGGGGGIPVVEHEDGRFTGVEAVVDKDFASALLASALGADLLVMTTGVPQVAIDFGTPRQRFVDRLTVSETEALLAEGQFPPGSMGPKIEAALQFLHAGGGEALITSVDHLADAVRRGSGTWLVRDEAKAAA
ncbi:MAG TPA: carbamate kinase [Solirubrobacter sp.]|nr:carbamate kinase [Solirubrobacter sp.]